MSTNHDNCLCHRPEYANHGTACPSCDAERDERDRIAEDNQREAEWNEREQEAELNTQRFADACGRMSQDDWDADNAWLESAGWGEM